MIVDPTLDVERGLFGDGARLVIGCDEVGRGAIAGPVAVGMAAITSSVGEMPRGVRDSKLISAAKRDALFAPISNWVAASAVGYASAHEVDEEGIVVALGKAGLRALEAIQAIVSESAPAVVVLDGSADWLSAPLARQASSDSLRGCVGRVSVVTCVKADQACGSVAAASVLAKVSRDQLMCRLDDEYVGYGFAGHKGYGTAAHFAAIEALGPSPEHRISWLHQPTMW